MEDDAMGPRRAGRHGRLSAPYRFHLRNSQVVSRGHQYPAVEGSQPMPDTTERQDHAAAAAAEPPEGPSRELRPSILAGMLTILGVLVSLAVLAGFVIRLPYVVISPDAATPLDDQVVHVSGVPTFAHRGEFLYLTVKVTTRDPSLWQVVHGWLTSSYDVVKREEVVDCLAPAENEFINARDMRQSQDDAKEVALTRLGYTVPVQHIEPTVVRACPGVPAYGKLHVGDQVVAIDDRQTARLTDISAAIRQHRPGDEVRVTVERDGRDEQVAVTAGRVSSDGTACRAIGAGSASDGTACLGISTQEFGTYSFPVQININTTGVGGPSAGLAFTLALIDDLTPGELTGGHEVAVTGAIGADGTVTEVGGVRQKATTARRAGARLMIVPRAELREARKHAGSTRVVGVETVDDALTALRSIGGAPAQRASGT